MKVNKLKVLVVPQNTKNAVFVCPCPVCTEKALREEGQYYNLQEVKNVIENVINSTSLFTKDFQIDISYTPSEAENGSSKSVTQKTRELIDIIKCNSAMTTFINQFEKQYRHPVMCELREFNQELSREIISYKDKTYAPLITDEQLWQFQRILHALNECIISLKIVHREDFIMSEKVPELIQKAEAAKKSGGRNLKQMYIIQLTHDAQEPTLFEKKYTQEYGY